MLRVLFFGRIREQLDCPGLELDYDVSCGDIDRLQQTLAETHGGRWPDVLAQENLIRAVNQEVAADNLPLKDGDEVAFFPPVTGG